MALLATIADLT